MNTDSQTEAMAFTIKAVCVMGFINATQMVKLIYSPVVKHLGGLYPGYFTMSVILTLVCLPGLWLQKKWAAIAYTILLAGNQVALLVMGFWEVTSLIIPAIIATLLYTHRDKFS